MNFKQIPLATIALLGLLKTISMARHPFSSLFAGWLMLTAIWLWNGWAYWKGDDMYGRFINIKYKYGTNEGIRTGYMLLSLIVYLLAFIAL